MLAGGEMKLHMKWYYLHEHKFDAILCWFLLIDGLFGGQWILLIGLGVLQRSSIEAFDSVHQVILRLLLLNSYEMKFKLIKVVEIWKILQKLQHTKSNIDNKLSDKPSIGGNEFFSAVSVCLNFVASKPSTPVMNSLCCFSAAIAL